MDPGSPANSSLRLAGATFEGAVEQISEVFGAFGGQATGPDAGFRWSTQFTSLGRLMLVSGHYEGAWEMWPVSDTPEMLAVIRTHRGMLDARVGKKMTEGTSGSLLLASNVETERFRLRGGINQSDVIFIDRSVIAKTVASTFDRPMDGPLCITPEIDLTTTAGRTIVHLVDTISNGMRPDGPLLRSPLAAFHVTEALASLILLNVPNRFSQILDENAASIAPRHVKQAIDFMHENIGRPITIQTVALAIGTSCRSLEIGFRTFKGTTPAAYLRAIRLEAAHSELCDPASARSVSEIALRWGFFHFGRFAETYKKAYGETPSQTKRQHPEP